ncbi:hypothetical protein PPYR_02262 [Photinus pyralis]|uniref:DUF659 domain-containing protein n=1 Tax=Photinus pyralis TaxID=7054 RepID=A0A5N4B6R7_PHOPY|nr:hypothetical protein PPYR_02262 [Photinus pyralis]
MPKNIETSIRIWLKDNPHLKLHEGDKIFCRICNKIFSCKKKFHIIQHENTNAHKRFVAKGAVVQPQISESLTNVPARSTFFMDLCTAMVAANIPWFKIDCPPFRNFLEKYTETKIPNRTTLSKLYLPKCYQNAINIIQADIGQHDIWICVDETTDRMGRFIANLIVGKLSEDSAATPYLLSSKVLERTNHCTVARFVNESLAILWPNAIQHAKVKIMYSDAAPYMLKTATSLKVFYPNLIHFTCIAHGLNLVAEVIREQYPNVNGIISTTKKIFLKAPLRVQIYKEMLPNTPLPPEPVLTRWGTWLNAAFFYNTHFEKIKEVVAQFDSNSAASIKNAQNFFNSPGIKNELTYIHTHFKIIPETIKKIEARGMPLTESLGLVETVSDSLRSAPGRVAKVAFNKLSNCLLKNPSYETLWAIKKIFCGDEAELPFNFVTDNIQAFKFAPITSCEVERSFSMYKNILTDKRHNLSEKNVEMLIVAHSLTKFDKNDIDNDKDNDFE